MEHFVTGTYSPPPPTPLLRQKVSHTARPLSDPRARGPQYWVTALYGGKYLKFTSGPQCPSRCHTPPMQALRSAEDVSLLFCLDQRLHKPLWRRQQASTLSKQNTHWPPRFNKVTKPSGTDFWVVVKGGHFGHALITECLHQYIF